MNPFGFFILDKPVDWTTFDLIRDLRKKTDIRKIGHTGTLDPFASGVAILCLDRATKFSSLLLTEQKSYLATMQLGERMDTGDVTGTVTEQKPIPLITDAVIEEAVRELKELKEQTPPQYSAVKVSGRPAYKYARAGNIVELKPKEVKIYDFKVLSIERDVISYEATVSKGTYIRSLSEHFAELLGTVAYTKSLRRTAIGDITAEQAVSPSSLTSTNWQEYLVPVPKMFQQRESLVLNDSEAAAFCNGRKLKINSAERDKIDLFVYLEAETQNKLIGLADLKSGYLTPKRVLK